MDWRAAARQGPSHLGVFPYGKGKGASGLPLAFGTYAAIHGSWFLIIAGPHGGAAIGIHQINQMRQPRMTRIETINRKTHTEQGHSDDQGTHRYPEAAPTALHLRRIGRGPAGKDEFDQRQDR